jgi:hypothetical protein
MSAAWRRCLRSAARVTDSLAYGLALDAVRWQTLTFFAFASESRAATAVDHETASAARAANATSASTIRFIR